MVYITCRIQSCMLAEDIRDGISVPAAFMAGITDNPRSYLNILFRLHV